MWTPGKNRCAVAILIALVLLLADAAAKKTKDTFIPSKPEKGGHHEFCVIGGGPGGLQTGHYLQELGFDYVIFERHDHAGSFFSRYPRNRNLISINKVHTGSEDPEFNLRHDWNSLMSDHPDPNHPTNKRGYFNSSDYHSTRPPLLFKEFSGKYYPHADDLVDYMKAYTERQQLKIRYEHNVLRIAKRKRTAAERAKLKAKSEGIQKDGTAFRTIEEDVFVVYVQNNSTAAKRDCIAKDSCPTRKVMVNDPKKPGATPKMKTVHAGGPVAIHTCDVVLLGTGKFVPNMIRGVRGAELIEGYESVSVDPKNFTNQQVLIVGSGNSGQELVKALEDETAMVQVMSRRAPKLSYQTHYVGHTRAVNLGLLDKYLLKSLDVFIADDINDLVFRRCNKTGRILVAKDYHAENEASSSRKNEMEREMEEKEQGDDEDEPKKKKGANPYGSYGNPYGDDEEEDPHAEEDRRNAKMKKEMKRHEKLQKQGRAGGGSHGGPPPQGGGPGGPGGPGGRPSTRKTDLPTGGPSFDAGPYQNILEEPGNANDPIYRLLDQIDEEEEQQEKLERRLSRADMGNEKRKDGEPAGAEDPSVALKYANKLKRNLKSSAVHEVDWTYRHQGFDRVIRCMGFHWDSSIFGTDSRSAVPRMANLVEGSAEANAMLKEGSLPPEQEVVPETDETEIYPIIASDFQSVNVPNLYATGSLMHFRDHKKSSGGFIHGFRYFIRSMALQLAEKYRGDPYPYMVMGYPNTVLDGYFKPKVSNDEKRKPPVPLVSVDATMKHLIYRLQNVSSLYQLQAAMSDVIVMKDGYLVYMQDIPLGQIKSLDPRNAAVPLLRDAPCFITLTLEFGEYFQGVGILHHHGQEEQKSRKQEKILWTPDAEPDKLLSDMLEATFPEVDESVDEYFDEDEDGDDIMAERVVNNDEPETPSSALSKMNKKKQKQKNMEPRPDPEEEDDDDLLPLEPVPMMKMNAQMELERVSGGKSNFGEQFLHPVFRFYARPPNEPRGAAKEVVSIRLQENPHNIWVNAETHLRPLRKFLARIETEMHKIEERGVLRYEEAPPAPIGGGGKQKKGQKKGKKARKH